MPLVKKSSTAVTEQPKHDTPTQEQLAKVEHAKQAAKAKHKAEAPMTKDDYWRRREERDIETSRNMAWSGLAQAALTSISVAQLNIDNTEDGLVALVARITDKLLAKRNSH